MRAHTTETHSGAASRIAAGNSIRGVSAKSVVLLVCYFSDPRSSSFARNFETAQNSQPRPTAPSIHPPRAFAARTLDSLREKTGSPLTLKFLVEAFSKSYYTCRFFPLPIVKLFWRTRIITIDANRDAMMFIYPIIIIEMRLSLKAKDGFLFSYRFDTIFKSRLLIR